jgi:ubiquinone/menaquinone biosynthesis C-methylase UbiE
MPRAYSGEQEMDEKARTKSSKFPSFTTAARVPEAAGVSTGARFAEAFNCMQASLHAIGGLETEDLLRCGIANGLALEVGAGPGYLGLDWLERTHGTSLVGLDSNAEMVAIARRNARDMGLGARARQVVGYAHDVPHSDGEFDAVFSSRSLHEWADPVAVFDELWRVLGNGGRLWVSDLRRDITPRARRFLERYVTSDLVRDGLEASMAAAYTVTELELLLPATRLANWEVCPTPLGLQVVVTKAAKAA